MSFSDFLDNITDAEGMATLVEELFDLTKEFAQDIIDLCDNEGMEIVRATPAAIAELSEVLAPLHNPTPLNILRAGRALTTALSDEDKPPEVEPLLMLPPPQCELPLT